MEARAGVYGSEIEKNTVVGELRKLEGCMTVMSAARLLSWLRFTFLHISHFYTLLFLPPGVFLKRHSRLH